MNIIESIISGSILTVFSIVGFYNFSNSTHTLRQSTDLINRSKIDNSDIESVRNQIYNWRLKDGRYKVSSKDCQNLVQIMIDEIKINTIGIITISSNNTLNIKYPSFNSTIYLLHSSYCP